MLSCKFITQAGLDADSTFQFYVVPTIQLQFNSCPYNELLIGVMKDCDLAESDLHRPFRKPCFLINLQSPTTRMYRVLFSREFYSCLVCAEECAYGHDSLASICT